MKRLKLSSVRILFAAVAICLVSCHNTPHDTNIDVKSADFDTIQVNRRSHLGGDTINPYCDIKVEFIYPVSSIGVSPDTLQHLFIQKMFGRPYENLSPQEAIKSYVDNYINNYRYDAGTYKESVDDMMSLNALIPGIETEDSEHAIDGSFYSYYEVISNNIIYNSHGVISFQVEQSNNKGGATSYVSYRNYVIDVNKGLEITEGELFKAGYDTALQNLIITSLLERNNVKSVEDLEDLGFFGVGEIEPNSNFLLTDKGFIYTYNKGEYSAYQLDAPEVFIPYTAIRSLLRDNTIATKLSDLK